MARARYSICVWATITQWLLLKVAFSQKGLICLSFLQTDEPNYFPELEI